MASPKPVPRCIDSLRGPAFTLLELLEDARLIRGAMPTPVSTTCNATQARRGSGDVRRKHRILGSATARLRVRHRGVRRRPPTNRARTATPTLRCVFDRVPDQVDENLSKVSLGQVRTRGSDAPTAIEKLRPRSLTSDSSSLATLRTNGGGRAFPDAPRGDRRDLRDVEHLIDEMP
jgi:hypothetical protein